MPLSTTHFSNVTYVIDAIVNDAVVKVDFFKDGFFK